MLRLIEVKYNIGLSRLAEKKPGVSIMLLDLIILQELLRIFMPIISINCDLK